MISVARCNPVPPGPLPLPSTRILLEHTSTTTTTHQFALTQHRRCVTRCIMCNAVARWGVAAFTTTHAAASITVQLGDVYAHSGSWGAAGGAWSTALDELLGQFGVVKSWRTTLQLDQQDWPSRLKRYGMHGLLQAGVLLGKLARCAWVSHP